MQLRPIAANQTEITLSNGTQVFFSYRTPVAAYLADKAKYVRTATRWSVTPSRHINKWLEGVNADTVNQETLDSLMVADPSA